MRITIKYDIKQMTETLCDVASVEYNLDLENLLHSLDIMAQNPYNADFRRNGLAIIAKVCEELREK